MPELNLGLGGLQYSDLFELDGLTTLDNLFLDRLKQQDNNLYDKLLAYRAGELPVPDSDTSELLISCAKLLEDFVVELFRIQDAADALATATKGQRPVLAFKKLFVQRRARRRLMKQEDFESFAELDAWLDNQVNPDLGKTDRELAVSLWGQGLLADAEANADNIETLTRWCIRAMTTDEGAAAIKDWIAFRLSSGIDHQQLVPVESLKDDSGRLKLSTGAHHFRDGFDLTDPRMSAREVAAEVDYCIYCHDHDGDFCSRGFPVKKGEPEQGLKTNPLGVLMTGCPLEEKISEMHRLKRDGDGIGALAMIMVDNPMCPATGHRICNDCMKACIYQKQQPVNIPEIETRVLTDVLQLPWGVEIYDLLTRWNPLRNRQWLPKPYNGLKVLVAGMGPAGFTLSHHLTLEGFAVVGIDGLKIEPLPQHLINQPIYNYNELEEALGERIMSGFGGVAEYGITVRWDKNFLKLIYISLMRRKLFQVFGGVRFGGTLTLETIWELGFDHVAIAVGAGLPQPLPIPGSLAPGMRMAADFLMALQLTGAARADSLANLQVRLPAVVIGGGLTGVDAATEVRAYYLVQIEKTLARYETLVAAKDEKSVRAALGPAELEVLDEHLEHGRQLRAERQRANAAGEQPDLQKLIDNWGGVSIVYRRPMSQSPAYTRNHEEVIKAMEEGVYYAECMSPTAAKLDQYGQVEALACERMQLDENGKLESTGEEILMPARCILVATGARPNIAYFFEHRSMEVDSMKYKPHVFADGALRAVEPVQHCKQDGFGPFTSYDNDGRRVTYIGDTHPDFAGNVVKAVTSGQRIYPKIVESFGDRANQAGELSAYENFRADITDKLQARVVSVTRLTHDAVELVIKAPLAASRYKPAQVFRLQNYETVAAKVEATRLQTETLPLTGSKVDADRGTISVIVRDRGASSRLVSTFKPGEPLVLMGPSGNGTMIPENEAVLIVGDWLAAAAARSLGPAFRARDNKVLLALNLPTAADLFCLDDLEAASDALLVVTDKGEPAVMRRDQDSSVTGDITEALLQYARGELHDGNAPVPLGSITHVQITASNVLLKQLNKARHNELKPYFAESFKTTGSIYSTMQCMLKGVCSQCLQWQLDPATGQRTKAVFACSWHDEPLDIVDLDALDERISQNRMQESLTSQWLDFVLDRSGVDRV
ncbi:MAG: FAD-dependent oxidoreductase [Gammaproteobacteria bacterium]|nr:FAD-dependent oxidoreductase [Gammaproteobacteria bacterium]